MIIEGVQMEPVGFIVATVFDVIYHLGHLPDQQILVKLTALEPFDLQFQFDEEMLPQLQQPVMVKAQTISERE